MPAVWPRSSRLWPTVAGTPRGPELSTSRREQVHQRLGFLGTGAAGLQVHLHRDVDVGRLPGGRTRTVVHRDGVQVITVRDDYGNLQGIIEEVDCTPEQKKIKEINPSYYCFDASKLFGALRGVTPNALSGEYYLTDTLALLLGGGERVEVIEAVPPEDVLSINTPEDLSRVDAIYRARGAAVASGDRVASARRERGVGARAKAARKAAARSGHIGGSDVWPSPLWLTRGTPPSGDTRRAQTTCFQSGRGSVAEPWVSHMACASLSGPAAPRRAQRGGARGGTRGAMRAWAPPARAHALNHRAPPSAGTASSVRPSGQRWPSAARPPGRHRSSSGVWEQNCGVRERGRLATPKPLRLIPATASPGVLASGSSGPRRASITLIRPTSCIIQAISPQGSQRSTWTDAICAPPRKPASCGIV